MCVFERSLQCIVAFWQTKAARVTTLFGLTGRFCGIARPLLIHGTVLVSLCPPWRWLICLRHGGEVNSPWKEKKNMQHESPLIIHLCRVSVWCDKSISIILHTDRNFLFCILHLRAWLSVSFHSHQPVRWFNRCSVGAAISAPFFPQHLRKQYDVWASAPTQHTFFPPV